ncbi:phosphoribosyl 1,2-cyclic phosphate phosphodiesterase [Desulfuromusa kysingii]|uniref:Phosphoribosyl 1,2-cyclic phosphate phosphodiesterase n=1 Tax=Desulfuromusa kysingii TaxID=37625 RepID=A0A1H3XH71_9BACT|nr:GPMC system MBL fold metallohydrolase [Desulfuromusa kysingii]SDZ98570.1 phosphoribosyl 1,2-cyclic phosphate phosphodiesterase [Desulfuromusa kysingii]
MQADTLKITVLGSGTSTGVPVIGCHCAVCTSNHPYNQRTRCSALLSYGKYNILIDTSTDLRQQALRENICHIEAVFYTHCHADHVHGIDDLRSFNPRSKIPIPLYGSEQTLTTVRNSFSYIFNQSEPLSYIPHLELHPIHQAVELFGLKIVPIPMRHGQMETFGYRCGPVAYLTDCNAIPQNSLEMLQGLELLILDGLRFSPHNTHFNIPQAIEMAQQINAKQTLLTHLSHEVNHCVHDQELPSGINLAHDGQQCSFHLELTK